MRVFNNTTCGKEVLLTRCVFFQKNMAVFRHVRAQMEDSLIDRVCRRHNDNLAAFFELLKNTTGVKVTQIDSSFFAEGTWEALER